MSVTLVLGGSRSGKSKYAEDLIQKKSQEMNRSVTYIATSPPMSHDKEWQMRVAQHRLRRPEAWVTVEQTTDLETELSTYEHKSCVIVDCLSLWLFNLISQDQDVLASVKGLCAMLERFDGDVILVSNEVGMGLVPENALGRSFRDAQGHLNQSVAAVATRVEFVVAGIAMRMKG